MAWQKRAFSFGEHPQFVAALPFAILNVHLPESGPDIPLMVKFSSVTH